MKYLRLFGVKQNKKFTKVIINDMRCLNNIDRVVIDRPCDKLWDDIAEDHLERCGFKIIGQVIIPKYARAYICEENPNSLVAMSNEVSHNILEGRK